MFRKRVFRGCLLPPTRRAERLCLWPFSSRGWAQKGGCTDGDRGWYSHGQPLPKVQKIQKIISSVFQSGLVSTVVEVWKRKRTYSQTEGKTARQEQPRAIFYPHEVEMLMAFMVVNQKYIKYPFFFLSWYLKTYSFCCFPALVIYGQFACLVFISSSSQ